MSDGIPLIDKADVKEEGPGIEKTSISFFLHALTNKYPGSLIQGVPASVIRAISLPDSNKLIILSHCFDSLKSVSYTHLTLPTILLV